MNFIVKVPKSYNSLNMFVVVLDQNLVKEV